MALEVATALGQMLQMLQKILYNISQYGLKRDIMLQMQCRLLLWEYHPVDRSSHGSILFANLY